MNNLHWIVLAAISCAFLCSCSERINIYVNNESGDPVKGAVVVHAGQEEIQVSMTDENGLASMEKNQDRVGIYRVSVEYMNISHEVRIARVSEIQKVILNISNDIWKQYNKNCEFVGSVKSHAVTKMTPGK